MPYAYRNASNEIVGLSDKARTIEEAQAINPAIVTVDSDPSEADIDTYREGIALQETKKKRVLQIDRHTDQLIEQGFSYGGDTFSLSTFAQLKLVGSDTARNEPGFVYPVVWNNIDNTGTISLADATELHGFYLLAVGTIRSHLDSGTSLKNQVCAATTMAELNAIVDDR